MMINHFLSAVNVLRRKSKFTGQQWKLVYYMVLFIIGKHKVTMQQLPGKWRPWRQTNPTIWGTGLAFRIDQRDIVSSLSTWTVFTTCLEDNSGFSCPQWKPVVRPLFTDIGMMKTITITYKFLALYPRSILLEFQ